MAGKAEETVNVALSIVPRLDTGAGVTLLRTMVYQIIVVAIESMMDVRLAS